MDPITCFNSIQHTFNTDPKLKKKFVSLFEAACLKQDIDTARAFVYIGIADDDISNTFDCVCKRNNTDTIKWFIMEYYPTDNKKLDNCLIIMCKFGNIDVISWLINEIKITHHQQYHEAFTTACKYQRYDLADYLLTNLATVFDEDGEIPALLYSSGHAEDIATLDLLLKYNIDIKSSLDKAFINTYKLGNKVYVTKLIECGADVSLMSLKQLFEFRCCARIINIADDDNYSEIFKMATDHNLTNIMDIIYQKYINNGNWHDIFAQSEIFISETTSLWLITNDYKYYIDNILTRGWYYVHLNLPKMQTHLMNVALRDVKLDITKIEDPELDEMTFYALCSRNKIVELMVLQNIYPQIVFRVDENAKIVDYSLNNPSIKSARNI